MDLYVYIGLYIVIKIKLIYKKFKELIYVFYYVSILEFIV